MLDVYYIVISFDQMKSESTWAVRKVSVHFEHLENRSHDRDVTWQLVRRDLTAHP